MLIELCILFSVGMLLCFSVTPVIKNMAFRIGAVDTPDSRKVHTKPIPRIGGLALVISMIITTALAYVLPLNLNLLLETLQSNSAVVGMALAATLSVFLLGLWDDIHSLSPYTKFLVQILAAIAIYYSGISVTSISQPFGNEYFQLGILSLPITVLWIVGVTNAFNLIDGLDGLACGTGIIALGTMAIIAYINALPGTVLLCVMIAGVSTGFLWHNFRPASIFLGDSGSLVLGFTMAALSIHSYSKATTSFAFLIPLLVLGFPLLDTTITMVRRYLSWFVPNKAAGLGDVKKPLSFKEIISSIFLPDKAHIHHKLINLGLSHRNTVLVLYAVSLLFGTFAVLITIADEWSSTLHLMLFLTAVITVGVGFLRYHEIALFHNGILLNLYKSVILKHIYIRRILDCVSTVLAFLGAYSITYQGDSQLDLASLAGIATLVLFIQQFSFSISGFYRETIQGFCIDDIINITKGILITLTGTYILFTFLHTTLNPGIFSFYILNFYLLFTLILGIRVSFHVLNHLYNKSLSKKDEHSIRTLIYGAGKNGRLIVDHLLNSNPCRHTIIGFLDENPNLENKYVKGYPILGGHWKLPCVIQKKEINEIIIADNYVHPLIREQLLNIASDNNINLYQYSIEFTRQTKPKILPDTEIHKREEIYFAK